MPFYDSDVPRKGVTEPPTADSEASLPRMIYHDLRSILRKFRLPVIFIIFMLLIYLIYRLFVFHTEASYFYLYEDMLSGNIKVISGPGTVFKIPLASRVTRYHKVWTVSFGGTFTGEQILKKGPIELRFADSYMAEVPVTFRYKLPTGPENLKRIHQDFTNQHNLIDSLLIPISENVMVSTATQYTGEEFFLGGLNPFQMQLLDQLQLGLYQTERKQFDVAQRDLVVLQEGSTQPTPLKVWKRVPIRDKDGKILRMKKMLVDYGIEVTQVTLRKPLPGPELKKLLYDKKRLDRLANEKANNLALIQEEQRIQLANIEKDTNIDTANKAKELALFQEDKKLRLARKEEDLELVLEERKIHLARKEKELAVELATTKAKKEEELVIAQENLKIHLTNIETGTKGNLAKKAEELALVAEENKIQLANVEKDKKTQLARIEKEEKMKLAKKAEELALVEEEKKIQLANVEKAQEIQLADKAKELALVEEENKIQLANVEKDKNTQLANKAKELVLVEEEKNLQLANVEKAQEIQLANKAKELVIIQEEQKIQLAQVEKEAKIQLAQVEKDKNTQLANKAKELVLVKESEKIQLAKKAEELAIVEAETKIQLAKKTEELAIAQEEQKIQKANFEVAQFEAKVLREKGLAEADVLKAMYQARIPEMYLAEIQREIAQVIYPNLKGVHVTMPRNIVNLGDTDNKLQTNLDVLSSFATLGVMEGLEKKALDASNVALEGSESHSK